MSIRSNKNNSVSNHREEEILEQIIDNNFESLKETIISEIIELDKVPSARININNNDLDNLDKLIDSMIIPQNQNKSYIQALNFLKKYS